MCRLWSTFDLVRVKTFFPVSLHPSCNSLPFAVERFCRRWLFHVNLKNNFSQCLWNETLVKKRKCWDESFTRIEWEFSSNGSIHFSKTQTRISNSHLNGFKFMNSLISRFSYHSLFYTLHSLWLMKTFMRFSSAIRMSHVHLYPRRTKRRCNNSQT